MTRPIVVVVVEHAGKRLSLDARIYTIAVDCGCWGHAFSAGRIVELAISPAGTPIGFRTRTDQPFTSYTSAGPVRLGTDNTESLVQQEQRDHAEAIRRIEDIKHKQLTLQEHREEKERKK